MRLLLVETLRHFGVVSSALKYVKTLIQTNNMELNI